MIGEHLAKASSLDWAHTQKGKKRNKKVKISLLQQV